MAIAAEFPDIDTLWSLRGPIAGFQHHRGITHTFVGIPFEAALLLGGLMLLHHLRVRRSKAGSGAETSSSLPIIKAPVRWALLYGCLVFALLSHILLDYTNNYGVRPFFPFDPHWYAGSIVFIFDPLLFLLLLAGLLLPSLFGLIAGEVGARRQTFRGAGWARAALLFTLSYWSFRAFQHQRATSLAAVQTLEAPAIDAEGAPDAADGSGASDQPAPMLVRPKLTAEHVLASPDPISPFRWYTAADYGPVYQLGTADTLAGSLESGELLHKPALSSQLHAAELTYLGRVYLDWSMMPWISTERTGLSGTQKDVTVTFQDVRFMGASPLLHRDGKVPLSGQVIVGPDGSILDESMDGRSGR